ncbi:hypothetical protein EDB85DRAFT_2293090 [Lactarius pseudohatsudake]|nr:hypothetical protein EDB85DRAFT_2293090 [Lactarius pseudohatsudake]
MMREELDQEQALDEDRSLDLDSDIGDEDRIIARIQDFVDENDAILRAKDIASRETHLPGRPQRQSRSLILAHSVLVFTERKRDKYISAELHDQLERRKLSAQASARARANHRRRRRRGPIHAEEGVRQKGAQSNPTGGGVRQTVVGHIRRFVQDLGSAPTLPLPLTARHARNSVLSGAHAFSLKNQSEGKDAASLY